MKNVFLMTSEIILWKLISIFCMQSIIIITYHSKIHNTLSVIIRDAYMYKSESPFKIQGGLHFYHKKWASIPYN